MKFTPKKLYLLSLAIVLTSSCKKDEVSNSSSHSVASWIKVLPSLGVTYGQVPIVTADDGGMYVSYLDNNNGLHIVKLSSGGDELWRIDRPDVSDAVNPLSFGISSCKLADNSLVVFVDKGYGNCFCYKVSSDGVPRDSSEFPIPNPYNTDDLETRPSEIYENADGSIIVLGTFFSHLPYGSEFFNEMIFVCKMDSNLNIIFSHYFGIAIPSPSNKFIKPIGIIALPGSGYLIDGIAYNGARFSNVAKYFNFTCLLNEDGDSIDSKLFETGEQIQTDNSFMWGYSGTIGRLYSLGDGTFITWVSRIDYDNPLNTYGTDKRERIIYINSDGDSIRTVPYSTPPSQEVLFGVRKNDGGFLLLTGVPNINSTIPAKQIGQSINVTDDGTVLQMKSPEQFLNFYLLGCCALTDGHYAIAGTVQEADAANGHICIIKTDENGYY